MSNKKTKYQKAQSIKADTDSCSYYANRALPKDYRVRGNAWDRDGEILFNGYDNINIKSTNPMEHHYAAQKNIYNNFDSGTLNKDQVYLVNMYYKGSPYTKTAFEDSDGNGIKGTHTGNLYWDEDTQRWLVEHNIHGTIHTDDFMDLLKPKGKYGVTAIQTPLKNNLLYKVYDWITGHNKGGAINYLNLF